MKSRPTAFEVDNHGGIACDIRIDPESQVDRPTFFIIDQDASTITVTRECLAGLLACADALTSQVTEQRA